MKRALPAVLCLLPVLAILLWLLHSAVAPPMTFAIQSQGPSDGSLTKINGAVNRLHNEHLSRNIHRNIEFDRLNTAVFRYPNGIS